jgi:DNA adenine methylase
MGKRKTKRSNSLPKPFLKWAGGKRQIIDDLRRRMPASFGGYLELFHGGGALFFELHRRGLLKGKCIVLADFNQELIDTYTAVRDDVAGVINALGRHIFDKQHYYAVRARDPFSLPLVDRAARMIYLNRAGYNGMYRLNRKGRFNIPFGRHKNPRICDAPNLREVSQALRGVDLRCESFEVSAQLARAGDFVYLDPPYVPVSPTASFTTYSAGGFNEPDQLQLVDTFEDLDHRGVYVMETNSDTNWVRDHYPTFRQDRVQARRSINCKAAKRGKVDELIIVGSYGIAQAATTPIAPVAKAPGTPAAPLQKVGKP